MTEILAFLTGGALVLAKSWLDDRRQRTQAVLSLRLQTYSELLRAMHVVAQSVQDRGERHSNDKALVADAWSSYNVALGVHLDKIAAMEMIAEPTTFHLAHGVFDATHEITLAWNDSTQWPDPEAAANGADWDLKSKYNLAADALTNAMRRELGLGSIVAS